ncbi:MAG: hypothetical protein BZY79_04455 [SAR202 cluster bacterium Casp-Chloro-G4]|nr:type II toxin-antitoxin system MqsA family antitoxin [Chloroflexota bacterium]MDA1228806.1 type II toxin-antitoxin system MqsA family antitoxin [Chloroflexota bacterium]PKB61303.1 MAG: hypothetical protein BZY79_04455 [SAR202 cluster bacterium Casp-Chloro-G4]
MKCDTCGGNLANKEVTYRIELDGRLIVVENVPARVSSQCGETYFSGPTVERIQKTAWDQQAPSRIIETAVFDFANT